MTATTEDTIRIPVCDAVRTALIELLTTGQHHHAATPTTLTQVGHARRTLAELHPTHNPAGHYAGNPDRHAALSSALGDIARALLSAHPRREPDTTQLRAGLTVLAAVALAWLDTLPTPNEHDDPDPYPDDDGFEDTRDPQPF